MSTRSVFATLVCVALVPAQEPRTPTPGAPDGGGKAPGRNWGPEQATGAPDTTEAGDFPTAWASASPDDQEEWLELRYARAVIPAGIRVFESHCPGALRRVCLVTPDGKQAEVWNGVDPTTPDQKSGVSKITFQTNLKVDRVRIWLDSKSVPGWNEIDAVALDDPAGKSQWAIEAKASSSYAEREGGAAAVGVGGAPPGPVPIVKPALGGMGAGLGRPGVGGPGVGGAGVGGAGVGGGGASRPAPLVPAMPGARPTPVAPATSRAAAHGQSLEDRVRALEDDVSRLQATVAELRKLVREQRR